MKKVFSLFFSISVYALFLCAFLYLIGFLTGAAAVPRNVDAGGPSSSVPVAILVDLGLIGLFGFQHSIMARQWFKRAWTRVVPAQSERSAYVLFACCALIALMMLWLPIPGRVWRAESDWLRLSLWILFAAGWLIVLASTFLINHFELFGLRQAWLDFQNRKAAAQQFRTPFLYRIVRHPLYLGFLIAFWAAPVMTFGHLLFATGMSAYILLALIYEERDLVAQFGDDYRRYQARVGKLVPLMRLRRPAPGELRQTVDGR